MNEESVDCKKTETQKMRKNMWYMVVGLLGIPLSSAWANAPKPWQIGFQEAASPIMERFHDLHTILLFIIIAISLFVIVLLIYTCVRFRASRNPIPSKTAHHTLLEIIWTVVPLGIVASIAVPSFQTLYFANKIPEAEMTLKVVGYQWYWGYEYPDHHHIAFDSYIIPDKEIKAGQLRLLEVDNRVVLPVDTVVRVLVTAGDVMHSWAIPSLGIKTDAVPGRVNETWLSIHKPGVYYGQCSELCGINHAFMPIAIEAVTKEAFVAWVQAHRPDKDSPDPLTISPPATIEHVTPAN
jgi:cytochrome c oxidase subunit II